MHHVSLLSIRISLLSCNSRVSSSDFAVVTFQFLVSAGVTQEEKLNWVQCVIFLSFSENFLKSCFNLTGEFKFLRELYDRPMFIQIHGYMAGTR